MVARYPRRLRGMATLPMHDPEAAVSELERVVSRYGFRAVELGTSIEGERLAYPKFRPVLRAIERAGCFVFAHPYPCSPRGGMEAYEFFNTIGFPLDELIMAAHRMVSGALDELRALRVVIAHGGYLPYQIGRFACAHRNRAAARAHTASSPRALLGRFYFDALTHDPKALRYLIEQVGADRIVLGSDHPFDKGVRDPLAELDTVPALAPEERKQIGSRPARALLGEAG